MEFDKALHFAVILAWEDIERVTPPDLVRAEYQGEPGSYLDYVSVWLSRSRGHQDLVCDYWAWTSSEHPAGARFRNGHSSARLAGTLEFVMKNQDQFTRLPDACRKGMVLTYPPTEEERAEAAAWLRSLRGTATMKNEEHAGTDVPGRPQDFFAETAALSRMKDEGYSTENSVTRRDAAGHSAMGGRLLLVGSPVF